MKPAARAMTAEEFARLPDEGMRQELVRGELREMPPPGMRHGMIASHVAHVLWSHVEGRGLGFVFGEAGFHIEHDPDTVRAPDCGFVEARRIEGPVHKSVLQNKPPSALRRRRPPASSLGLNDRLRKIASASLLASGSPALANRSGAHSATRSKGYFQGAPDLAVEVLSPSDRPRSVSEKVASWLECGSRLVWVIDPDKGTVAVHRPLQPPRTLSGADSLDGLDVLPGFRFPIAKLFA